MSKSSKEIAVLVTTEHRGVFFGYISGDQDMEARSFPLARAKCAIYWATKDGIAELAKVGPNDSSRIGAEADIAMIHDVTAIWICTDEAIDAWTNH